MLIHEAAILAQLLDDIAPVRILDIGSGSRAGREIIQPHIAAAFNGHRVCWTDKYPGPGVLMCDITDRETLQKLPQCGMVTACSILEHVTDIDAAIENLRSLVTDWLIVSVPYSYPEHHCPIDNLWRPSPVELRDRILAPGLTDILTCNTQPETFNGVENASVSMVVATTLISPRGYWLDDLLTGELFDDRLAQEIATCVDGNVADLGCGRGNYVSSLRRAGIEAIGIDGNPRTKYVPHCYVGDLTLPLVREADWALCLEVGEHIPSEYEDVLFENIAKMASKGAIVSWATPGAHGVGHVNCRSREWVVGNMGDRGLFPDASLTARLRDRATLPYFKENLLVFLR